MLKIHISKTSLKNYTKRAYIKYYSFGESILLLVCCTERMRHALDIALFNGLRV